MKFKAGVKHRLRFYNMTIDDEADVIIENDSGVVKWTPLAKDAMPDRRPSRTPRPARLHVVPARPSTSSSRQSPVSIACV